MRRVLENVGRGDKDPDRVVEVGGTRRMRINLITFTETFWEQEGYDSTQKNVCSFTFLYTIAKVVIVFISFMHFIP